MMTQAVMQAAIKPIKAVSEAVWHAKETMQQWLPRALEPEVVV